MIEHLAVTPLTSKRTLVGMLLVVAGTGCFAITVVIAPFIYDSGSDPLTFIWFRSIVVAVVLPISLRLAGQPLAVPVRDGVTCALIGLLMTIQTLAFFTAISLIPVSIGTLIEYTYPFQVAIVARVLYGEALSVQCIALIVGALVGLMLVIEITAPKQNLNSFGVGLMVAASFLLTAKTMTTHRVLQRVDSRRTSLYLSVTVATVCSLAYLVSPVHPAWPTTDLGWSLLAITPVCSLAGMLCFYTGLARIGPGRASMLANFEPVFILILAVVLLAEVFTLLQSIGAVVVLVCVLWFQWLSLRTSP